MQDTHLEQELESRHWCEGVTDTDWFYRLLTRTFNWALGGSESCPYLNTYPLT